MPHVAVKLYPGRTEQQKEQLARAIADDLMRILGSSDASVSVSIEEVDAADWAEKVYRPQIVEGGGTLYKKPGYSM